MSEKFASKDEFYLSKIRTLEAENVMLKLVNEAGHNHTFFLETQVAALKEQVETARKALDNLDFNAAHAALIQESE